jgi:OOP family OmpA-OmpF porin
MRILSGILAVGMVVGVSSAALAETNGFYLGAEAGGNFVPDLNLKSSGIKGDESNNPGWLVLGKAGYGFGPLRVEEELGWRQNGFDKINRTVKGSNGGLNTSGSLDALTVMTNVYYDISTGTPFTPYIGAGVGAADLRATGISAGGYRLTNNDNDWVFAYQGIAGLSYDINSNLSLNADYHYLRTTEASFNTPQAFNYVHDKLTYESHAVLVGFTYKFGAPPPAPTPVAAPIAQPAPAATPTPPRTVTQQVINKSFIVFFDFDKSDITAEARRIITQAAEAARTQHATTVQLTGYTDAAGSDKYNQALSIRRGNAVKVELVKLGVPANEIAVIGKGKSDPLVPTKDGVREPQNRRVQILLP